MVQEYKIWRKFQIIAEKSLCNMANIVNVVVKKKE
ncbi:hypothetical protein SAMN06265379_10113 [Saccharicrinis carchari]|uniref:Uncharacterized protein n=1 Tax=Saccharicrinis carchari TaxID=1168039 RepID=A0A521AC04_SACCC|nr:hypothetical protein SAMN06265379_10113 [Saccharicrinis carchari]